MPKSVYLHIPFCEKICSYCDFCKILYYEKVAQEYLEQLELEVQQDYQGELLDTLYIGGGTPTCLSLKLLKKLSNIISNFSFSGDYEFTIEGNFESLTEEKIDLLLEMGVNRISLGLESTHLKHLKKMNRVIDFDHIEKIISYARERGLTNINLDLIYALPEQTMEEIDEDLDYLLSLKVPHLSTYSLMIEENTVFGIQKLAPISEDLDFSMYQHICNRLEKTGYLHYEISNFAKNEYWSRHNMIYWKNQEYYGFGLGASSYTSKIRKTNTKSITQYLKGKTSNIVEEVSSKDEMEYQILLSLRTKTGVSKKEFEQRFDIHLESCYNYNRLLLEKVLVEENNHIFIPEEYWYVSNEIIVRFLEGEKYE